MIFDKVDRKVDKLVKVAKRAYGNGKVCSFCGTHRKPYKAPECHAIGFNGSLVCDKCSHYYVPTPYWLYKLTAKVRTHREER